MAALAAAAEALKLEFAVADSATRCAKLGAFDHRQSQQLKKHYLAAQARKLLPWASEVEPCRREA